MEAFILILALVGAEIIASIIKKILFRTKAQKAILVKEKSVPIILIVRYPIYDDKEMETEVIRQFQNAFKNSPYQLILQADESVDNFVFEYPKNFYCDSMKPVNDN